MINLTLTSYILIYFLEYFYNSTITYNSVMKDEDVLNRNIFEKSCNKMSSTFQKEEWCPSNKGWWKERKEWIPPPNHGWSLLGDHRQSADDGKTEEESSLGITTCHFNSIRHERFRRRQVTVRQSYCSAIYRPTLPLFAYKRETRGRFSMSWAAPLPFLSLENLKWSQRVNRMLLPVWFMSSWKTYPNIFAIASPRILGNFLHFEMRNTRPCMCDVTKRTSRFWFYFGKKVLI